MQPTLISSKTPAATLPLAPLVQNIDLLRTEYTANGTTERTTRDWAESLQDEHGKSLKCDVENGSNNRAVQVLVPLENLTAARHALRLYKESIVPFNMRETTFAERVHQAHPTEIYVPTIVAQNNLSLLNMSTSSVWANAPASVRSPTPENPQNTYQAPTFGSKTGNSKPPGSLDRTGEDDGSKKKQAEKRKHDSRNNGMLNPGSNPVLTSNVSTATTNLMTNTLGTHQACFHDLENEIRQRNESIKTQQKEFSKVNERLDVLETQTMSTLHFCKESSQNVLELHQETSSQLLTVRQEAATNVLESRSNFAAMTALIQQLSMQLQAANQPAPSHTGSCSSH